LEKGRRKRTQLFPNRYSGDVHTVTCGIEEHPNGFYFKKTHPLKKKIYIYIYKMRKAIGPTLLTFFPAGTTPDRFIQNLTVRSLPIYGSD
jgi:hypothetical protein